MLALDSFLDFAELMTARAEDMVAMEEAGHGAEGRSPKAFVQGEGKGETFGGAGLN